MKGNLGKRFALLAGATFMVGGCAVAQALASTSVSSDAIATRMDFIWGVSF